MSDFKDLLKRHAMDGRVDWLGLRAQRLAPVSEPMSVEIDFQGLQGDHARSAARAVTLIQAEHLPAIAALAHCAEVTPDLLRRNIVVSGINLTALRHRHVQLGEVVLKLEKACPPCSRMERALGPGGYNAMRGHGGWYASVISGGQLLLGDPVRLAPQQ